MRIRARVDALDLEGLEVVQLLAEPVIEIGIVVWWMVCVLVEGVVGLLAGGGLVAFEIVCWVLDWVGAVY